MHDERHPVLEYLVFGAAAVLALILAYYGFMRWDSGRRSAEAAAPLGQAEAAAPDLPASTGNLQHSGTVEAVGELPAVKLSGSPKALSRRSRR